MTSSWPQPTCSAARGPHHLEKAQSPTFDQCCVQLHGLSDNTVVAVGYVLTTQYGKTKVNRIGFKCNNSRSLWQQKSPQWPSLMMAATPVCSAVFLTHIAAPSGKTSRPHQRSAAHATGALEAMRNSQWLRHCTECCQAQENVKDSLQKGGNRQRLDT